jgi:hypothetical protein
MCRVLGPSKVLIVLGFAYMFIGVSVHTCCSVRTTLCNSKKSIVLMHIEKIFCYILEQNTTIH